MPNGGADVSFHIILADAVGGLAALGHINLALAIATARVMSRRRCKLRFRHGLLMLSLAGKANNYVRVRVPQVFFKGKSDHG